MSFGEPETYPNAIDQRSKHKLSVGEVGTTARPGFG